MRCTIHCLRQLTGSTDHPCSSILDRIVRHARAPKLPTRLERAGVVRTALSPNVFKCNIVIMHPLSFCLVVNPVWVVLAVFATFAVRQTFCRQYRIAHTVALVLCQQLCSDTILVHRPSPRPASWTTRHVVCRGVMRRQLGEALACVASSTVPPRHTSALHCHILSPKHPAVLAEVFELHHVSLIAHHLLSPTLRHELLICRARCLCRHLAYRRGGWHL